MKILDRYLISNFLKPFIYSIIAFTSVMIIADVFEMANTLITFKVRLNTAVKFFLFKVPQTVILILPVSTLLATLFSLGKISSQNEITAMKASCIHIYRIFVPILVFTLFISILSFFFNEFVATNANKKVNYIKKVKIKKINIKKSIAYNISLHLSNARILKSEYINEEEKVMENVNLLYYTSKGYLKRRVDAKYAFWNKKFWIFKDSIERVFNDKGEIVREVNREEMIVPIAKSPKDILDIVLFEKRKPEEIDIISLYKFIKILKESGSKITNYLIELHMKISFPMVNFIISLIGAPLAIYTTLKGRIAGFGISIFISFLYWGTIAISRSLGKSEVLSPILSAWMANIIFGFLGVYLLIRIKK